MTETRLWLIGNLLMRVDRIMPANGSAQILREKIRQEFSALEQAEIKIFPVSEFNSNQKLNTDNEQAIREYLRQAAAADSMDPFGIFYAEKSPRPAQYLQISFQHKNFSDCRNLFLLPRK